MNSTLPIEALRPAFEAALAAGPVVVSAPTGSGKSTRVPTWCLPSDTSRVLVVEPRRVACRSLAQRVAELEGGKLGGTVGYHVRDDHRAGDDTRILFATPGIVLRRFGEIDDGAWDTVVLDELHERGLETDLILALLTRRLRSSARTAAGAPHLVVMSATLAGDQVAEHVGGRHVEGEGRAYPVAVRHLGTGGGQRASLLPDPGGLEGRVVRALAEARDLAGDVLVFLPGKGEIRGCAAAVRSAGHLGDLEVVELHGGLSLGQQNRAFARGKRRKVVLATNVAETSVTIPGIGVVIDSGLVRQTRWYRDRGFLSLVPIAEDSATQRTGRAGRTAPGVALRLWDEAAQLAPRTPPEIHRESLTPLLLAAAACGERVEELPFLDPPKEEAVAHARDELEGLGALDGEGRITERGEKLFGLPLDPALGRLLVEAAAEDGADAAGDGKAREVLEDVVDLVSGLATGGPPPRAPAKAVEAQSARGGNPAEDPERCDAVALLVAVRGSAQAGAGGSVHGGRGASEALTVSRRLREAFGLPRRLPPADRPIDRRALARIVLAANPRAVHVARRRGRRVSWAAGGPELVLARESAVASGPGAGHQPDPTAGIEAIAVLDTHAVGSGFRDMLLLATCAMPLPLAWLREAGLGEDRLGQPKIDKGRKRIVATVRREWAGRLLDEREEVPRGDLARGALVKLFLEGRVFPQALEESRRRLQAAALARGLAEAASLPGMATGGVDTTGWDELLEEIHPGGVPELEGWVEARVADLGVESGADLALLSAADLTAPELPWQVASALERDYPLRLELPDATYEMDYAVGRREVTLVKVSGTRKGPPSLAFLPRLPGFKVKVRHGEMLRTLR